MTQHDKICDNWLGSLVTITYGYGHKKCGRSGVVVDVKTTDKGTEVLTVRFGNGQIAKFDTWNTWLIQC